MLIGLVGKKNSGKDTFANYLKNKYNFEKYSFAEPLKQILSILFSWDIEKLKGIDENNREWREKIDHYWSKKLNILDFSPRKAMQIIGTDLFRDNFNENFWVILMEKKINDQLFKKNIVISDCRFENECKMIKENKGIIILIKRNENNQISDTHKSENIQNIIKYIDYTIENNKKIEDFYENIDILMNKIIYKQSNK